MKEYIRYAGAGSIIFSVIILLCPLRIRAQDNVLNNYERDTLISYKHGISDASKTWEVPHIVF